MGGSYVLDPTWGSQRCVDLSWGGGENSFTAFTELLAGDHVTGHGISLKTNHM